MYDTTLITRYQAAYRAAYGAPVRGLSQEGNRLIFPVEGIWPQRIMSEGEVETAIVNLGRGVERRVYGIRLAAA